MKKEKKSVANNRNRILFLIGLYSVFIGAFYAIILINNYRYNPLPPIPILFILIVTIPWLLIGGILSFKKQATLMMFFLLLAQVILEILSLPSFGWIFLLGTLLFIAIASYSWFRQFWKQ